MSADNDDSEVEEKKSYNFIFRLIVFTFIAGPASVFAFGLYGRVGIKNAIEAMDKGEYSPMVFLVLWIGGLISTGVMVFKR
jgi:hypothetical protein